MTWNLDAAHTQVHFSVRHMMISSVRGKFTKFEAHAEIDPSEMSNAKVTAKAFADSIDTGEAQRDTHLKSGEFFDVENFPTLDLETTKVTQQGDSIQLEANLSIKGTTQVVKFEGDVMGPAKDPWGKQRVGVSVQAKVDREAFGLTWNQALETGGVLVGKTVTIELDVQFVED